MCFVKFCFKLYHILTSWSWHDHLKSPTIRFLKIFSKFLLFCYYLPLGKRVVLHLYNSESPLPKDNMCQLWLKLAQRLWRRCRKCKSLRDRRTKDGQRAIRKAHLSFQLRWAKKDVFIMHLYLKYQSSNTFGSKDIVLVNFFFSKLGQSSRSRSQGQKSWYQKKGLFIIHLYLMYLSHNTFRSKDIALVKVFQS
jgi:hypothetical protein